MHIQARMSAVSPPLRAAVLGGGAVVITAIAAFAVSNWTSPEPAPADYRVVQPLEWRTQLQAQLDLALTAYDRGDRIDAAVRLRTAANILRDRVQAPSASASGSLTSASLDLDAVALEAEKGRTQRRADLTRVLARTQLAQGEHHRALATSALHDSRTPVAGQELAMAIDHYERAQVDAGATVKAAGAAVKNIRALSLALLHGGEPADAADRIGRFGSDIQRSRAAIQGPG